MGKGRCAKLWKKKLDEWLCGVPIEDERLINTISVDLVLDLALDSNQRQEYFTNLEMIKFVP